MQDTTHNADTTDAPTDEEEATRLWSYLPECDADEAHCERHGRDMCKNTLYMKSDGTMYISSDGYAMYHCPDCVLGLSNETGTRPAALVQSFGTNAFRAWWDDEAPAGWFRVMTRDDLTGEVAGALPEKYMELL